MTFPIFTIPNSYTDHCTKLFISITDTDSAPQRYPYGLS
jgi:hypothetical protein